AEERQPACLLFNGHHGVVDLGQRRRRLPSPRDPGGMNSPADMICTRPPFGSRATRRESLPPNGSPFLSSLVWLSCASVDDGAVGKDHARQASGLDEMVERHLHVLQGCLALICDPPAANSFGRVGGQRVLHNVAL